MLSRSEARRFYDRFGSRQDRQAFYEDKALAELVLHAELESARSVFELGCGTGRLAERMLRDQLPADASYLGVDISSEMVRLARERLAGFGARARVVQVDGEPRVAAASGSFDRFVSSYVFDLLPEAEIRAWLDEAARLLRPGGRLAAAGLGHGTTRLSRWVAGAWGAVHARFPRLVGGCRPLALVDLLPPERWRLESHRMVIAWGLPSEVLVASLRSGREGEA